MALPKQLGAYEDCAEVFLRASNSPGGTRVLLPDQPSAKMFQMRMNMYRSLERQESRKIYERGDPLYDKTEFDGLRITIHAADEGDGTWWAYVRRHGSNILEVEDLEAENGTA